MQYTDERHHLRVSFDAKGYDFSPDDLARLEAAVSPLAEVVDGRGVSELAVTAVFHSRSNTFRTEARLKTPGHAARTAERHPDLREGFRRCVSKLARRLETAKASKDGQAAVTAERRAALDRDVVAPEDPADGPLGALVRAGDYKGFRTAMSGYEEWLRKRVGRWVQRYPEAERQIGEGLLIGDLIEEVFLSAFENFIHRPTDVRLSEWLDHLIDPSLKLLLRDGGDEREAISFARTLR